MRLTVRIENGSLVGQQFTLAREPLHIGLRKGIQVCFDAEQDSAVCHDHAVIEPEADDYALYACEGQTSVNGLRVTYAVLRVGDVIVLGDDGPRLIVENAPSSGTETVLRVPGQQAMRRVGSMGGLLALLLLLVMVSPLGIGGALAGLFAALLPAPLYLMLWLWLDRYDPEPPWALAGAFAWGAGVAAFLSLLLNTLVGLMVGPSVAAVWCAPLIEEGSKGLGLAFIFWRLRDDFDGILDGIAYAGMIALGFATVENVIYYGRAYVNRGGSGLAVLFVLRGLFSPFSHALYTSLTGIGIGLARETTRRWVRLCAPVAGYGMAVVLHRLWNGAATQGPRAFLQGYIFLDVPVLLSLLLLVVAMALKERRAIARMLANEVASGLITEEQRAIAASLWKRVRWTQFAPLSPAKRQARGQFLRAVSRLAVEEWHRAEQGQTPEACHAAHLRAQIARLQADL